MADIYLRDLNETIREEFTRDIVENRSDITPEQIEEGNISIGTYYNKASDYELI